MLSKTKIANSIASIIKMSYPDVNVFHNTVPRAGLKEYFSIRINEMPINTRLSRRFNTLDSEAIWIERTVYVSISYCLDPNVFNERISKMSDISEELFFHTFDVTDTDVHGDEYTRVLKVGSDYSINFQPQTMMISFTCNFQDLKEFLLVDDAKQNMDTLYYNQFTEGATDGHETVVPRPPSNNKTKNK